MTGIAAPGVSWRIEGWDPAYGASTDEQPGQSRIDPVLDVERPAGDWAPVEPGAPAWPSVLFVDGVRRIDAMGWGGPGGPDGGSADGVPSLGLFASYAAGVVRCRPERAELLDAEVHRGLFSGAGRVDDVDTAAGRYVGHRVALRGESPPPAQQLSAQVQDRMRAAELAVSLRVRAAREDGDLLVVDGPLHNQLRLPGTLGYAKTHATHYLPPELNRLVGTLAPAQRTPVFGLRDRFSWYLKLPGGSGAPWAGVVRVECWADLDVPDALRLAGLSQATLCRYASCEYKDSRAPQNLYPIAGLEFQLRRRLGDQRLLHRAIRAAVGGP